MNGAGAVNTPFMISCPQNTPFHSIIEDFLIYFKLPRNYDYLLIMLYWSLLLLIPIKEKEYKMLNYLKIFKEIVDNEKK